MEQFGLEPLLHLLGPILRFMSRPHPLRDLLASFDALWWIKLAISLASVILAVQLIGGGRKADEQRYWRMYR